jgi:UDP-galactose transporter B1
MMIAVTITAGLIIFNSGKIKGLDSDAENYFGIFLVLTSLLFDGYSSSYADKHNKVIKRDFAYHSMLYTNCVIFVLNAAIFAYTMATDPEEKTLDKINASPELTSKVVIIALCGAVGQIFVYFTLSLYNGYKLGIITTTRKCFSVLISAFAFNHKFTNIQWIGVSMVLTSTVVEFFYGNYLR